MYGFLIAAGLFVAILISRFLLIKKSVYSSDAFWKLIFYFLVAGVVGARVYHVIDKFSYYSSNPILIFEIYNGGLAIYGAVMGILLVVLYFWFSKIPNFGYYLDSFAVTAPLAQSIGRLGNYFNSELYGKITTLPWGISIPDMPGKYHPLFAYESVLNVILFGLLLAIFSKSKFKSGAILYLYLAGYSLIRFLLEFLRIDPWTLGGLNVAQIVSILLIGFAYARFTKLSKY